MRPFTYYRPSSLKEAFAILDDHGDDISILSGGTDLLVDVRHGKAPPKPIVDIKRIADLPPTITDDGAWIKISATANLTDITADERISGRFPALVEAMLVVGSIQIRNRASLVGNICNASPAADTTPVLVAYDATVTVESKNGRRTVPVAAFVEGNREIALGQGELVTSVNLPTSELNSGSAFVRLTRRRGVDLATINLCCRVGADDTTVFVLGAAAPKPLIIKDDSGSVIAAGDGSRERDDEIAKLMAVARPISDVRASAQYRQDMFRVLGKRAFARALERRSGKAGVH